MNAIVETLTEEEIVTVQVETKRVAGEHYASFAAAARDAGIAESTFSAFINSSYSGDNAKVAIKARAWLNSRAERAKTAAILPKAPSFQLLPTSQKILPALTWAQVAPAFVPMIGAPGLCKTTTAEHYAATNPNVWMVTITPTIASAAAMLAEICETMDIAERSTTRMARAVGKRVKGLQALIIIDEAQHMAVGALEEARSLVDRAKVGVALLGNRTLHAKLYGEGKESHGQLFSRAGVKVKLTSPQAGDICQMIAAWGVTEPEEVAFLKAAGRKIGALRNIQMVMKLAGMLAAGAGQPRTIVHLRAAWEQIDVNLATDGV